jgi:uncharacterized membrane protein (UPF0127 family)
VAHCLSPLARDPKAPLALVNLRTGLPVATRLIAAFDSASRRQGLLGRSGLADGDAVILAPCSAIHTAFMQFPIDVLFLDRAGNVLKTAPVVPPWRVRMAWRGFAVVELAAGALRASETRTGDGVELRTIV